MSRAVQLWTEGDTIIVRVPLQVRRRGGRKLMVAATEPMATPAKSHVDDPMLKALSRAHRWKQLLESGEFASIRDLAVARKINHSYIRRILRLTLLSPTIIEMILDGRQPRHLQLETLLQPLSTEWVLQEKMLAGR